MAMKVPSPQPDGWWWRVSRELARRYAWSREEVRGVPLSELQHWLAGEEE
jgi:hypothetical protein